MPVGICVGPNVLFEPSRRIGIEIGCEIGARIEEELAETGLHERLAATSYIVCDAHARSPIVPRYGRVDGRERLGAGSRLRRQKYTLAVEPNADVERQPAVQLP